jgi:hypothetical protein
MSKGAPTAGTQGGGAGFQSLVKYDTPILVSTSSGGKGGAKPGKPGAGNKKEIGNLKDKG